MVWAALTAAILSGPIAMLIMMAGHLIASMANAPGWTAAAAVATGRDGMLMVLLSPLVAWPLTVMVGLFAFLPILGLVASGVVLSRRYVVFRSYYAWMAIGAVFGAVMCPLLFSIVSGKPPTPLGPDDFRAFASVGAIDGALCAALARRRLRYRLARGDASRTST